MGPPLPLSARTGTQRVLPCTRYQTSDRCPSPHVTGGGEEWASRPRDARDVMMTTRPCHTYLPPLHHYHDLSLIHEGRWGTTDDFTTSYLHFFPVLHCPMGLVEPQTCPFPDAVFPPLPLSALSSSPFRCALQDGFDEPDERET